MVKCPYCGMLNGMSAPTRRYESKYIVTCDKKNGGCGKDFVAAVRMEVIARTLKVEGETDYE